jgi:hypothetical protein
VKGNEHPAHPCGAAQANAIIDSEREQMDRTNHCFVNQHRRKNQALLVTAEDPSQPCCTASIHKYLYHDKRLVLILDDGSQADIYGGIFGTCICSGI